MKKLYEDINMIVVESNLVDLPIAIAKNYMGFTPLDVEEKTGLRQFYMDKGLSIGLWEWNRFSKVGLDNDPNISVEKDGVVLDKVLLELLKENPQWLDSSILTKAEKEEVRQLIEGDK